MRLSTTKRGFTLVELLAVIAIVSFLAAIIIPLLGSVRKTARTSQCAGNLRQLHTAAATYAAENRGLYVPNQAVDAAGISRNWYDDEAFQRKLGEVSTGVVGATALTLRCPSAGDAIPSKWGGYGINNEGNTGNAAWSPGATATPRRRAFYLNRVPDPAKTMAFADSLDWQLYRAGIDKYTFADPGDETPAAQAVAFRHAGAANVVFLDGHLERLDREQFKQRPAIWILLPTSS
ncbi:MAG TPA: prepilin-type N-terminal cleavage/methylation domain-containing protein [Rariglobus sp.]